MTHEASYLPFVFTCSDDASGSPPQPVKLRGRRTWNKRGQEVTEALAEVRPAYLCLPVAQLTHKDPFQLPQDDGSSSAREVPAEHQTTSKRLTSISGFGPGSSSTKETKRAKSRNTKSAQEIIHEATTGSGEIRLKTEQGGSAPAPRTAPAMSLPPSSAVPLNKSAQTSGPLLTYQFLKPAGVDEPSDNPARGDGSRPAQPEADMSHGTRRQNIKRGRDDHQEASAQTADRKRKKSGAAAAA